MLNIQKLSNKDIGRWVRYETFEKNQTGRIKSFNDNWVFVVYRCDNRWNYFQDYTGEATNPVDLTFID